MLKDIYLSFFYGAKIGIIWSQRIKVNTTKNCAGLEKSVSGRGCFLRAILWDTWRPGTFMDDTKP